MGRASLGTRWGNSGGSNGQVLGGDPADKCRVTTEDVIHSLERVLDELSDRSDTWIGEIDGLPFDPGAEAAEVDRVPEGAADGLGSAPTKILAWSFTTE